MIGTVNELRTRSDFHASQASFLQAYPSFAETALLDTLRDTEYGRLDRTGQVYLDYTGGGLYGESQLDAHLELLKENVFGNPHSLNPTSLAMTSLAEQTRQAVFAYFNAAQDEYVVIFTPNASGALKLVGESYPFAPESRYLLLYDNHNSVNGIREFARNRGAQVTYLPVERPEMRADSHLLRREWQRPSPNGPSLFAYPAQSNFTGVQHPLGWIDEAHRHGWDVLLDAAAFAPTNRLDLGQVKPDFVSLSFYKIFGYPTGVGALLARRSTLEKLHRPWFAGGTISIVSVQGEGWHFLLDGEAGFEDGTINYLSLPAVEIGLRHIQSIGIDTIHERVRCLTGWLLEQMTSLRHSNGAPLCQIYGPTSTEARGGTIAFNLRDPEGRYFDYRQVESQANEAGISLRTGCFCNPGAGEIAHEFSQAEMARYFAHSKPVSFDELFSLHTDGNPRVSASTVRISVGLATNFADAFRFIQFLQTYTDQQAQTAPLPTSDQNAELVQASTRDIP